jgi:hypothetical protein
MLGFQMYVRKGDANKLLKGTIRQIFTSFEEKQTYLNALWDDDDWAFVIKAQALIEDAITGAILAHAGEENLRKTVIAMPLVGEVSKLDLSKDLGILDASQRRFVKRLAALRNKLAHRPDHVSFSFDGYVSSLSKDERRDWKESIPWFDNSEKSGRKWGEIALKNPRAAIYIATFILASLLELGGSEKQFMRNIQNLSERTMRELLGTNDEANEGDASIKNK